jgi:phosphatidate cytidylyltransferase
MDNTSMINDQNLIKRALSAVILGPSVLWCLWKGIPYSTGLIVMLYFVALWEWKKIFTHNNEKASSFNDDTEIKHQRTWMVSGYIWINMAFFYLLYLAQNFPLTLLIGLLLIIWANDVGGYIVGKTLGRTKLCPSISPNKTWEGTLGGIVASFVIYGFFSVYVLQKTPDVGGLAFASFIACIASVGDLLESAAKRFFGVKDSSNIIPGHGGLLDRIDGLLGVGVILCMLHYFASIHLAKEFLL